MRAPVVAGNHSTDQSDGARLPSLVLKRRLSERPPSPERPRGLAEPALQRSGEMRLVVVASLVHHIQDRDALLEEGHGLASPLNLAHHAWRQPGDLPEPA